MYSLFSAIPDVASVLLVLVSISRFIPEIQRFRDAHRIFRWSITSILIIIGAAGLISSSSQRAADKLAAAAERARLQGQVTSLIKAQDATRQELGSKEQTIIRQGETIVKQQATIQELATSTSKQITGGHTFPVVGLLNVGSRSTFQLEVVANGRYSLTNLQIRIAELNPEQGRVFAGDPPYRTDQVLHLEGGYAHPLSIVITLPADVTDKKFNVFMDAPHGRFTQLWRLDRLNDGWHNVQVVLAEYRDGKHGVVWRAFDKDFPIQALDAEWLQWDTFDVLNVAKLDSMFNTTKNAAIILKNGGVLQLLQKTPQSAAVK